MKVAALVQRLERQRMLPRAVLATFIVVSFVSIFRMKLVKVVSAKLSLPTQFKGIKMHNFGAKNLIFLRVPVCLFS